MTTTSRERTARWPQILASLAAVILVLHVVWNESSFTSRLLSLRPAVWVGKRSYGLYLYHRTIAILLPALIPSLTLRTLGPASIALSVALAAVSFRYIERPLVARRSHVAERFDPHRPSVGGVQAAG